MAPSALRSDDCKVTIFSWMLAGCLLGTLRRKCPCTFPWGHVQLYIITLSLKSPGCWRRNPRSPPSHPPFLSRAERIRPSDQAEPFASDWTSKCLHFHLLIYSPVAPSWRPLCYCDSFLVSFFFFFLIGAQFKEEMFISRLLVNLSHHCPHSRLKLNSIIHVFSERHPTLGVGWF